jgi:hypothetical protein
VDRRRAGYLCDEQAGAFEAETIIVLTLAESFGPYGRLTRPSKLEETASSISRGMIVMHSEDRRRFTT